MDSENKVCETCGNEPCTCANNETPVTETPATEATPETPATPAE